ncbi:isochorismate synthase [Arthrobacter castelli]|uniref:isochorismate synthase n=1 Tax=Arthrobacter castelli TaxID=271431 RepID=UPI00040B7004|nr:isochorismate synthase [Arthrobacter castelli]
MTIPSAAVTTASSTAAPASSAGPLRSITVELGDITSLTGLLDYLVRDDLLCWIRHEEGLVGFGELARIETTGPERFEAAQQWWRHLAAAAQVEDHVGLPGTGPVAFGSFTFSSNSEYKSWLIVPRLIVGSRDGQGWLTQLASDGADVGGELTAEGARAALEMVLEGPEPDQQDPTAEDPSPVGATIGGTDGDTRLNTGSLSEEQWKSAVTDGVEHIKAGALEKLVLARDVVAHLSRPVDTAQVLRELAMRYRECWTYGVDGVIGSTPEMLIMVEGDMARARVLAGTLDRANAPHADARYAEDGLTSDEKQRHEHQFAIESLTRQLEPFTSTMTAHSEPFVLELPNVWHLASDVTAELARSNGQLPTSLALAAALHPTAAVCGTPTEAAATLIHELEHLDRGPYAGPVGWMDAAGNGEWGIALRGAVVEDPLTIRLFAGCGIVAASDPEAELAETWAKFRPMLQAIGMRS